MGKHNNLETGTPFRGILAYQIKKYTDKSLVIEGILPPAKGHAWMVGNLSSQKPC